MGKVRFAEQSVFPWGEHIFPVEKYQRCVDHINTVFPSLEITHPQPLPLGAVERVHSATYLERIKGYFKNPEAGVWEFEAPCSVEVYRGVLGAAAGTLSACRDALKQGWGFHIGGGFHHAFPDHGEGFCILNDVAISLAQLLHEGAVSTAAVLDLDVHQGNGTAVCFAQEERVHTISLHQENNYPAWKPPSDLDIGLPDGMEDSAYLEALGKALTWLEKKPRPDLVLFLAGADPFMKDQLGGLALSKKGLRARDDSVGAWCQQRGIPLSVVLAGGYAKETGDVVEIHLSTLESVSL